MSEKIKVITIADTGIIAELEEEDRMALEAFQSYLSPIQTKNS